jgi:hypothetical protein
MFADIAWLFATMDLQNVLQPVNLSHLACLFVDPIDLFGIKVFSENGLMLFT